MGGGVGWRRDKIACCRVATLAPGSFILCPSLSADSAAVFAFAEEARFASGRLQEMASRKQNRNSTIDYGRARRAVQPDVRVDCFSIYEAGNPE